jgi:NADPH:quinone reductase
MKREIPATMQAVGLDGEGHLVCRNVPVPKPEKGEVLVKMEASPVNPSDLARIKNAAMEEDPMNFIAGIEGSGTIVNNGKGWLPRWFLGRRVACSFAHSYSGTWAEYMVTGATRCIPLPADINNEQGSMLLVNPMTVVAFIDIARRNRHKAMINTAAASSLGRMLELMARQAGISLINIVRNEKQKRQLLSKNSRYVLDSSEAGFPEKLYALSRELDATLVLDAVGGNLTRQIMLAMPPGSFFIIYGNLSGEQPEIDHRSLVGENMKVSGFFLGNWLKEANPLTLIKSIRKARILLKNQVTIPIAGRFPLSEVQSAVDTYLGNMTAGKILLIQGKE